ncbi:MAG: hypothetical protein Q8S73_19475 [Deltaproteobacteria bacterium]|nr:hypothetical protein [Myxococcales bacterium]MDP3216299.1 hypothetical protein [Deltaproteobacteria bacterium]
MRAIVDQEFAAERARYALRHACEDCVFFVDETGRCANGYPNAMHRDAAFTVGAPVDGTFCKDFELR